uniref:Putative ovule protein n=1 Tax=Solanum chacoense TaxID=4108 RepID=A0A0V0H3S5_SOLCH
MGCLVIPCQPSTFLQIVEETTHFKNKYATLSSACSRYGKRKVINKGVYTITVQLASVQLNCRWYPTTLYEAMVENCSN